MRRRSREPQVGGTDVECFRPLPSVHNRDRIEARRSGTDLQFGNAAAGSATAKERVRSHILDPANNPSEQLPMQDPPRQHRRGPMSERIRRSMSRPIETRGRSKEPNEPFSPTNRRTDAGWNTGTPSSNTRSQSRARSIIRDAPSSSNSTYQARGRTPIYSNQREQPSNAAAASSRARTPLIHQPPVTRSRSKTHEAAATQQNAGARGRSCDPISNGPSKRRFPDAEDNTVPPKRPAKNPSGGRTRRTPARETAPSKAPQTKALPRNPQDYDFSYENNICGIKSHICMATAIKRRYKYGRGESDTISTFYAPNVFNKVLIEGTAGDSAICNFFDGINKTLREMRGDD